jgi:hypothetical protein
MRVAIALARSMSLAHNDASAITGMRRWIAHTT